MSLSNRLLHTDELVRAHHVECRPHGHTCGAVESSAADFVVFPARGTS